MELVPTACTNSDLSRTIPAPIFFDTVRTEVTSTAMQGWVDRKALQYSPIPPGHLFLFDLLNIFLAGFSVSNLLEFSNGFSSIHHKFSVRQYAL